MNDVGAGEGPDIRESMQDLRPEEELEDLGPEEELDPAEELEDFLETIAEGLGLDVRVEVEEEEGLLSGRLVGEDVGLFIGRHGQTIDAVQHLAQRIIFPEGPSPVRVVIDAGGYRERREESLRAEADDAAQEALLSDRPVELDPMPPWERRVVHEHLRERGGLETHSEGAEPTRFLVISPLRD